MSILTRVFVVLLVLLSMLMSAGVVVFVSRVDKFKERADTAEANLRAAQSRAASLQNDFASQQQIAQDQLRQQASQIEAMRTQVNNAQQQVADRDVRLADTSSKMTLQAADISRLSEGLKASQDTQSKLQDIVTDLRKGNDDLTRKTSDLNTTVSELTNKLDVTERERRYLSEQLTESQSTGAKMAAALKDNNITLGDASAGAKAGAPPINGVVRAVKPIAGIPYATISVGSADNVSKGMEFKIVDQSKGFLGILTVDTVEPNEAAGRLTGPRIQEVKPGVEVRTQL